MAQPLPPLSAGAVQAIADGAPDIKAVVQIIGTFLDPVVSEEPSRRFNDASLGSVLQLEELQPSLLAQSNRH